MDEKSPPFLTQVEAGKRVDDQVWLSERALCSDEVDNGNEVVRVSVDGEEWYFGKVRYEQAAEVGFEPCTNGFFVEVLKMPEASE